MESIPVQTCTCCKQTLPATPDNFHPNAAKRNGVQSVCKSCFNARRRAINAAKPKPFSAREGYKICRRCKEEKLATPDFFSPNPANLTDGLHSWCKPCCAEDRRSKPRLPAAASKVAVGEYQECRVCKKSHRTHGGRFRRAKSLGAGVFHTCKSCENAAARKRRGENIEYVRERERNWERKNRHLCIATKHRRRARVLNSPTHHTGSDILRQLKSQKGKCYWCGTKLALEGSDKYHVDHLIALSKGGTNGPENIVCACPKCNFSKNDKMPYEFCGRLL